MGISTSPAIWQQFVDHIIQELKYPDDYHIIMIATSSPTPYGHQNCRLYVLVITESLPGECICPGSGQKWLISWESLTFPAHQHQTI